MAENLPVNFPIPGESAIASYNYTDIIEGTGILNLYGYTHKEESTLNYSLSTQTTYSAAMWSTSAVSSTSYVKVLDLDFDLTSFNLSKTIRGVCNFNVCAGGGEQASANSGINVYIVGRIRKWDGASETEVCAGTSEAVNLGGTNGYRDYWNYNFEATAPRTTFKKGDVLRVTIEVWAKYYQTSGGNVYLLHDAKNRLNDGTALVVTQIPKGASGYSAGYTPLYSTLTIKIPFNIDL